MARKTSTDADLDNPVAQPDDNVPPRDPRPLRQRGMQRQGPEGGDDPASGSVESPVSPGEAQAGNLNEQAQNLGGPVDVFPLNKNPPRETSEG
jgi:hypothetical protein